MDTAVKQSDVEAALEQFSQNPKSKVAGKHSFKTFKLEK